MGTGELGGRVPEGLGRGPPPWLFPPAALAPCTPSPAQAHRRSGFGERRSAAGGAAAPPGGSEWGTCRHLARCFQRFVIISPAFLISKKPLAGFISSCEECCLGQGPGWATSSGWPSGLAPPLRPLPGLLEGRCSHHRAARLAGRRRVGPGRSSPGPSAPALLSPAPRPWARQGPELGLY